MCLRVRWCNCTGINLLSHQNLRDLRPNKFVYPSNAPLVIDPPTYFKRTLTFHTGLGRTLQLWFRSSVKAKRDGWISAVTSEPCGWTQSTKHCGSDCNIWLQTEVWFLGGRRRETEFLPLSEKGEKHERWRRSQQRGVETWLPRGDGGLNLEKKSIAGRQNTKRVRGRR